MAVKWGKVENLRSDHARGSGEVECCSRPPMQKSARLSSSEVTVLRECWIQDFVVRCGCPRIAPGLSQLSHLFILRVRQLQIRRGWSCSRFKHFFFFLNSPNVFDSRKTLAWWLPKWGPLHPKPDSTRSGQGELQILLVPTFPTTFNQH